MLEEEVNLNQVKRPFNRSTYAGKALSVLKVWLSE